MKQLPYLKTKENPFTDSLSGQSRHFWPTGKQIYYQKDMMVLSEGRNQIMEITKDTKVSAILQEYGDIADVMEVFGIKRVGRYSLRRLITKALSVETAARIHRVPLDEFIETLNQAILL